MRKLKTWSGEVTTSFPVFMTEDRKEREFDAYGFDDEGFTQRGFDRSGIHKVTGDKFSDRGYDIDGYNRVGAFCSEFGFYRTEDGTANRSKGWNSRGFTFFRKHHITGTEFDPDGFNAEGFNSEGIHRETGTKFSPGGFDVNGISKEGIYVSQYHKMRG